ncbi:DUF3253 domain-containing protein [Rhodovulum adriaticum]
MDLAHRRGRGKTLCPSEVARELAADWRPLMPRVSAPPPRACTPAVKSRSRRTACP